MLSHLLDGQVALVTASTSGIGLETAAMMAQSGARAVVINGRNQASGEAAVREIRQRAPAADLLFVPGDLTDPDAAQSLVDQAIERFGPPDVFMHCGGAQVHPDLFVRTSLEDARALLDGHFMALVNCCHAVVPRMVERGRGSIIVVASDAAKVATPGEALIGACKAAAVMFTRALALEVSRHGVRANALTPSIVRNTKSHARVMSAELSRKVFEKAEARARLGVPVPSDIAPLAVFLASPLAARITGQAISVNGGISAA